MAVAWAKLCSVFWRRGKAKIFPRLALPQGQRSTTPASPVIAIGPHAQPITALRAPHASSALLWAACCSLPRCGACCIAIHLWSPWRNAPANNFILEQTCQVSTNRTATAHATATPFCPLTQVGSLLPASCFLSPASRLPLRGSPDHKHCKNDHG